MEQNQFEGLEEVEQEETLIPDNQKELKEYEKLLLAENNRELTEKAINLVNAGCFNQVEEPVIDFSKYTRIETGRKFRGLYNLYQNNETMELVFICPLVENNKGDVDEKKNMAPYAYDCIITEAMDEETYQMVLKAAKHNISVFVPALRITAYVVYLAFAAIGLVIWAMAFFTMVDQSFVQAVYFSCLYACGFITADVIGLPLLFLMEMKYRKYKEQ